MAKNYVHAQYELLVCKMFLKKSVTYVIANEINPAKTKILLGLHFNPIQDGHFQGCSWMEHGGDKISPLPKICHTYPTMMKLGTVIPYLKKIQNIFESCKTPFNFC